MSAGKALRNKNLIRAEFDGIPIVVRRASLFARFVNNDLPMSIANAMVADSGSPAADPVAEQNRERVQEVLTYQTNLAIECCIEPKIVAKRDDLAEDEIDVETAWAIGLVTKVYQLATGFTEAAAAEVQRLETFRPDERGPGESADSGEDSRDVRAAAI